jgi:hypothetical protein
LLSRRWYQLGIRSAATESAEEKKAKKAAKRAAKAASKQAAAAASAADSDEDASDSDSDDDDEEDDVLLLPGNSSNGGANNNSSAAQQNIDTSNMFGYIDESGAVVYINMADMEDESGSASDTAEGSTDTNITAGVSNLSVSEPAPAPVGVADVAVIIPNTTPTATASSTVASSSPVKATTLSSFKAAAADPAALTLGAITCQQNLSKYFLNRTEPSPRINPCLMIRGSTLYVYGGVTELGDVEITLDDCWSLDLNKRDKWKQLLMGTMHNMVWKGEDYDTGTEVRFQCFVIVASHLVFIPLCFDNRLQKVLTVTTMMTVTVTAILIRIPTATPSLTTTKTMITKLPLPLKLATMLKQSQKSLRPRNQRTNRLIKLTRRSLRKLKKRVKPTNQISLPINRQRRNRSTRIIQVVLPRETTRNKARVHPSHLAVSHHQAVDAATARDLVEAPRFLDCVRRLSNFVNRWMPLTLTEHRFRVKPSELSTGLAFFLLY